MSDALRERLAALGTEVAKAQRERFRQEARLEELRRQSAAAGEGLAERGLSVATLPGELTRLEAAVRDRLQRAASAMGAGGDAGAGAGAGGELSVAELRARLRQVSTAVSERRGQRQRLAQEQEGRRTQSLKRQEDAQVYDQVILLLQQTAEHARNEARSRIEALVTSTLQSVFGASYRFVIELVERGGRPEADFFVLSEYEGEPLKTRIQDARGGGIVDVASLGLRIAMLETYRPRLEGALILDEPAKHVSDEFIQATARFFQAVSEGFGRQIIMVTHDAHLAETAPVAYQVVLKGDRSVATRTGPGSTRTESGETPAGSGARTTEAEHE